MNQPLSPLMSFHFCSSVPCAAGHIAKKNSHGSCVERSSLIKLSGRSFTFASQYRRCCAANDGWMDKLSTHFLKLMAQGFYREGHRKQMLLGKKSCMDLKRRTQFLCWMDETQVTGESWGFRSAWSASCTSPWLTALLAVPGDRGAHTKRWSVAAGGVASDPRC